MPQDEIVTTKVPFIGLLTDQQTGLISPQRKHIQLRCCANFGSLSHISHFHSQMAKTLGKLCWYSTLARLCISTFSLVYKYPRPTSEPQANTTLLISADQQDEIDTIA